MTQKIQRFRSNSRGKIFVCCWCRLYIAAPTTNENPPHYLRSTTVSDYCEQHVIKDDPKCDIADILLEQRK